MLKNNRGVITVESMIAMSVFIIVMTVILSIFSYFLTQEIISQKIVHLIEDVEIQNYLFEKIGDFKLEGLEIFEEALNELPLESIREILDREAFLSKSKYIEGYLENRLKAIDESVQMLEYNLSEQTLRIKLSISYSFPFGYIAVDTIAIEKKLWLFGNQPEFYNHITLADLVNNSELISDTKKVYVTKSGTKYHLATCFYIRRSTTDQGGVKTLKLKIAKVSYQPCKRCILKGGRPWN